MSGHGNQDADYLNGRHNEFTPEEVKRGFAFRNGVQTYCCYGMYCEAGHDHTCRYAAGVATVVPAQPLAVWFGPMPESNGKTNWTAILHRGDLAHGFTIERSEHHDRVRYEADRVRHLIGELAEEPDILAYDADMLSPRGTRVPAHELADWRRLSRPSEPADGVSAAAAASDKVQMPDKAHAGIEVLHRVVEALLTTSRYVDEEGEATMALADLLACIADPPFKLRDGVQEVDHG